MLSCVLWTGWGVLNWSLALVDDVALSMSLANKSLVVSSGGGDIVGSKPHAGNCRGNVRDLPAKKLVSNGVAPCIPNRDGPETPGGPGELK